MFDTSTIHNSFRWSRPNIYPVNQLNHDFINININILYFCDDCAHMYLAEENNILLHHQNISLNDNIYLYINLHRSKWNWLCNPFMRHLSVFYSKYGNILKSSDPLGHIYSILCKIYNLCNMTLPYRNTNHLEIAFLTWDKQNYLISVSGAQVYRNALASILNTLLWFCLTWLNIKTSFFVHFCLCVCVCVCGCLELVLLRGLTWLLGDKLGSKVSLESAKPCALFQLRLVLCWPTVLVIPERGNWRLYRNKRTLQTFTPWL